MKGLKLKYKKLYRKVAKDAKGIEIYRIGTDDSVKIPALWQNMVLNPCLRDLSLAIQARFVYALGCP